MRLRKNSAGHNSIPSCPSESSLNGDKSVPQSKKGLRETDICEWESNDSDEPLLSGFFNPLTVISFAFVVSQFFGFPFFNQYSFIGQFS